MATKILLPFLDTYLHEVGLSSYASTKSTYLKGLNVEQI